MLRDRVVGTQQVTFQAVLILEHAWAVRTEVSLVLHLGDLGGTLDCPLLSLELLLLLVDQHVGSEVDRQAKGLRTESASHLPPVFFTLLRIFLSMPTGSVLY